MLSDIHWQLTGHSVVSTCQSKINILPNIYNFNVQHLPNYIYMNGNVQQFSCMTLKFIQHVLPNIWVNIALNMFITLHLSLLEHVVVPVKLLK